MSPGPEDHPRSRGVYYAHLAAPSPGVGSSPLARGLHRQAQRAVGFHGIIPARAGFTTRVVASIRGQADHPRSRGVYKLRIIETCLAVGSSPLARGLPRHQEPRAEGGGIIPARAGFTWGRRRSWERRTDHPRSRGVYAPIEGASVGRQGSSPLARGLLVGALGEGEPGLDHPRSRGVYGARAHGGHALVGSSPLARGLPVVEKLADWFTGSSPLARGLRSAKRIQDLLLGIIPARAGFTPAPAWSPCGRADHPRSRGVYRCGRRAGRGAGGSSPLARGLPEPEPGAGTCTGIIPARAGFTHAELGHDQRQQDHPRSRGVYDWSDGPVECREGSSPLARGLQRWWFIALVIVGIIPARAGFTGRPALARGAVRDHPRSRGVYRPAGTNSSRRSGSSPLARGLRTDRTEGRAHRRIIPARAGFTPTRVCYSHMHWDHPRSRGVYFNRLLHEGEYLGIIPARAGFTSFLLSPASCGGDHPRSRGVYLREELAAEISEGSSPLARGLRGDRVAHGLHVGIIPARAGFTLHPALIPYSHVDHPRSRGVYAAPPVRPSRRRGSSPLARGLPIVHSGDPGHDLGSSPLARGLRLRQGRHGSALVDHPRSRGVYRVNVYHRTRIGGSSPLARGLRRAAGQRPYPRRIIPARAGFTMGLDYPTTARVDHPRSRGVYTSYSSVDHRPRGSSPLARGLRLRTVCARSAPGIIPARAGFTDARGAARVVYEDHPRSRGVY